MPDHCKLLDLIPNCKIYLFVLLLFFLVDLARQLAIFTATAVSLSLLTSPSRNCTTRVVVLVSMRRPNKSNSICHNRSGHIVTWAVHRTCWSNFCGESVRINDEMYTLTNVAIKYWQSKRSIIPPWPGMMSPKSYSKRYSNRSIRKTSSQYWTKD